MTRIAIFVALLLAACDAGSPSVLPHPAAPPATQAPPATRPPAPWPTTLTDRQDGFADFVRVVVTSGSVVYRHGITFFESGKFYDWADGPQRFSDCVLCIGYGSYEVEDTTIAVRYEYLYGLDDKTSLPVQIVGSIKGDTLRLAFPSWMAGVSDVYMDDDFTLTHRADFTWPAALASREAGDRP